MPQLHATCVAVDGLGVLIRGPSGSGKSDLALLLIDAGARLVADDRCDVAVADGRPVARAPEAIAGLLEVRGLGILRLEALAAAPVGLVVDLVDQDRPERLPEPATTAVAGIPVPLLRLYGRAPSAAAKVRLAVALARGGVETVEAVR